MDLKKNFKKTEIGFIPNDWQVASIGEICDIKVGRDLHEDRYSQISDYNFKYPVFSNTVSDYGHYGYYNFAEYEGEAVTVVGRGVGLGCAFPRTGCFGAIGRLLVLFPNKSVKNNFLFNYINNRITILNESGGIPQLTGISFSKYKVPVPPLKEQEAIANTLSDADAYIESLEKFISKKRLIKKGVVQELLSGKRRLSGFNKNWSEDDIENVCEITTGSKNTQDRIENGHYPFFVRSQTIERINTYSFDGEAVLTAGDGVGTGKVFHYINGKFDVHQRVYRMSNFREDVEGYYFYLFFSEHFYDRIMQMTAKSSVDSVRREMIARMKIKIPEINEQRAIAQTLKDLDLELKLNVDRLQKARLIKQGMMQELLTGRIRLV